MKPVFGNMGSNTKASGAAKTGSTPFACLGSIVFEILLPFDWLCAKLFFRFTEMAVRHA